MFFIYQLLLGWEIKRWGGTWDDINIALVTGSWSFCWFVWIKKPEETGCWSWPPKDELKLADCCWVLKRIKFY